MSQALNYQLVRDRDDVVLVIKNRSALLERERELMFPVAREQVRELAAVFADMDQAFEAEEARKRAGQRGMSLTEQMAERVLELKQRKEAAE